MLDSPSALEYLLAQNITGIERLSSIRENLERHREEANAEKERRALVAYESFFDTIERQPLTDAQRRACVRDEDNNLVLAGAGSGKTAVIVARASYLVKAKLAVPGEILVLAFNRKAADEVSQRLRRVGVRAGISATTFHSFGLRAAFSGRNKPSVSPLAEDDAQLPTFVLEWLRQNIATAGPVEAALRELLIQDTGEEQARDTESYLWSPTQTGMALIDAVRRASMADDARTSVNYLRVKSQQELVIANFLYLNGVKFEYEPKYPHPTATFEYRQYQPDFYLPEYDIYLEHFAVNDESHSCPDWIDKEKYLEGVRWKRDLHARHETTLVETCSADSREPLGLTGSLDQRLRAAGVTLTPIPLLPLFGDISLDDRLDPRVVLIRLLSRFLVTAKASLRTDDELSTAAAQGGPRYVAFLRLAQLLRRDYEAQLQAEDGIDFTDMLVQATAAIRSGEYSHGFKYVLVDEFQDLSAARAQLLLALRDSTPDLSLFGVGDDWQSIYGFTGADVTWTSDFVDRFGLSSITALDSTFRFDQLTADVSRAFITRNDSQTDKPVTAQRRGSTRSLNAVFIDKDQDQARLILDLLAHDNLALRESTVLLLSRYRESRRDHAVLSELRRSRPDVDWQFSTIHQAKGREADFVVVLGLTEAGRGFPSRVEDDPVLRMVLPVPELFPHAEERRLMYVAMTRGRIATWLIAHTDSPSAFVTELCEMSGPPIRTLTVSNGRIVEGGRSPRPCPACGGGVIVQRSGPFGAFYGCSHYPACSTRFPTCPSCETQPFVLTDGVFRCIDDSCGHTAEACPKCITMATPRWTGFLAEKTGKFGPFLGCRNWRPKNQGCTVTRPITSNSSRPF